MHSAVALDIEGRHEHAPRQRAAVEILHGSWLKFEKELLNPRALRARLIRNVGFELPRARPWKKSQGGVERIAKHFDRCVDVPKIIRVVDRSSPSVASAVNRIAVTGGRPDPGREILVAEERGCRPHRVEASE